MISILIVEDHAMMGRALIRVLEEQAGWKVEEIVSTAEVALEKLKQTHVDLVIIDVSLPRMSGIDLVSLLHEKYPDLPCMMLSGHTGMQYVTRSLLAGARGYVVKDDITGIVEGIQTIMAGKTYISENLR
jgi:DNA-binding NarL/FixJ family response regulator